MGVPVIDSVKKRPRLKKKNGRLFVPEGGTNIEGEIPVKQKNKAKKSSDPPTS